MRYGLAFAALVVLALPQAHADSWPADRPLPQDAMLAPTLQAIRALREDIQKIKVMVDMGAGEENPYWLMSHTQAEVFLDRLETLQTRPLPEDDVWPKLKKKEPAYKGITLLIETVDGKRFAPLLVFEGRIAALDSQYRNTVASVVAPDYGRYMEYWLFGTARVRRDQLLGVHVMPVLTFEQCRLLGQRIVETTPRQCLLPDNNLLLESNDFPTFKSASIESFEQCLQDGTSLIYTFPRRCVATGGRVFTEPPKVAEVPAVIVTPAAASLAAGGVSDFSGTALENGGLAASPLSALRKIVSDMASPTLPVMAPVSASGGVSGGALGDGGAAPATLLVPTAAGKP